MPRRIVLDTSAMRPWALRALWLGLADRDPPLLRLRWSASTAREVWRQVEDEVVARRGATAATDVAAAREAVARAYPDAAVADADVRATAERLELDLLERRDADAVAAAVTSGGRVVVTTGTSRLTAVDVGRLDVVARHPDEFLVELLREEPWRVLHATVLLAHRLRAPERAPGELLAALAAQVPRFAEAVAELLGRLPRNQPEGVFAATHGQADAGGGAADGWWCIACDPFPCPGGEPVGLALWGTAATFLPTECSFVGVTQTAQHWTLVWPARDDPTLLEMAERLRADARHPEIVPYAPAHGPAWSYYAWVAGGQGVHGVHGQPPA